MGRGVSGSHTRKGKGRSVVWLYGTGRVVVSSTRSVPGKGGRVVGLGVP